MFEKLYRRSFSGEKELGSLIYGAAAYNLRAIQVPGCCASRTTKSSVLRFSSSQYERANARTRLALIDGSRTGWYSDPNREGNDLKHFKVARDERSALARARQQRGTLP